jgi:hypothetical protein
MGGRAGAFVNRLAFLIVLIQGRGGVAPSTYPALARMDLLW